MRNQKRVYGQAEERKFLRTAEIEVSSRSFSQALSSRPVLAISPCQKQTKNQEITTKMNSLSWTTDWRKRTNSSHPLTSTCAPQHTHKISKLIKLKKKDSKEQIYKYDSNVRKQPCHRLPGKPLRGVFQNHQLPPSFQTCQINKQMKMTKTSRITITMQPCQNPGLLKEPEAISSYNEGDSQRTEE